MSVSLNQPNLAYGQSQGLVGVMPLVQEVSSIPGITTRGVLGQTVIYVAPDGTRAAYMLIGVAFGNSIWVSLSGGDAFFHNLLVTGTLTVDGLATFDNNVNIADGGALQFLGAGGISFAGTAAIIFNGPAGGITINNDSIINLDGTTPGLYALNIGTPTVSIGGVIGGIDVALATTDGAIITGGGILGGSVQVDNDLSAGFSPGTILGLTHTRNTTQGVGDMTILSTNGNPGNNAGYFTFYIGNTPAYVPYFLNIAP